MPPKAQSYCLRCKKKTSNSNITYKIAKNGAKQMLSTCTSCKNKKSGFVKK